MVRHLNDLTPEQFKIIKRLYMSGIPTKYLYEAFDLSERSLDNLISSNNWPNERKEWHEEQLQQAMCEYYGFDDIKEEMEAA